MKQINSYIQAYLDYLFTYKNYSNHTISNYELDLTHLKTFMKQYHLNLNHLDKKQCRLFIESHFETKKRKTLSRYISTFRSFWNYLVKQSVVKENPWKQVKLPKQAIQLPHTLSTEDILLFLNNIDTSSPLGLRNKAICETLYGLGLRVAELCSLKLSDCDFTKQECLIHGKGNYERIVYIGNVTLRVLENYVNNARSIWKNTTSTTLFINKNGSRLSERSIQRIVKQCAQSQGFTKPITPHTFRHCYASDMYKGGADIAIIKELLGHKNLSTTEIYTHVANEDLAQTLNESHPRAVN